MEIVKKNIIRILITLTMVYAFTLTAFAETKEIEVDGQTVTIETIGNVKLIDPVYIPQTRSGFDFSFNINDSLDTPSVTTEYAKWQVQTQAVLRNYQTGVTNSDGRSEYTVSVMRGEKVLPVI